MLKRSFILAGGQGTRLRPVTLEIPKPLIPVQGIPIATWLIRLFVRHGVQHITVIYPTRWKAAFESWRETVHISQDILLDLFEEKEALGTMGALVHEIAQEEQPFFVTNGDELKGLDLTAFGKFHLARDRQKGAAATIALVRVPNPSEYGVAEMTGEYIARFHEKPAIPPSTLISSGLYALDPHIVREADASKRFLMFEKDLFPQLAQANRLYGCELAGAWYDCGTMERWEKAIKEWEPGSTTGSN